MKNFEHIPNKILWISYIALFSFISIILAFLYIIPYNNNIKIQLYIEYPNNAKIYRSNYTGVFLRAINNKNSIYKENDIIGYIKIKNDSTLIQSISNDKLIYLQKSETFIEKDNVIYISLPSEVSTVILHGFISEIEKSQMKIGQEIMIETQNRDLTKGNIFEIMNIEKNKYIVSVILNKAEESITLNPYLDNNIYGIILYKKTSMLSFLYKKYFVSDNIYD